MGRKAPSRVRIPPSPLPAPAASRRLHSCGAAPVAQLDRASVYGTEGQRFESSRARFKGPAKQGLFSFSGWGPIWTVSQLCPETPISGHVYRFEGARGPVWRAKYRLPDGRQIHRTIGPAWTERGRPRAGWYTKRTAEAWLRDVLDQAHAGTLPGMVRTGVTFADACAEYLRYVENDLDRKPSTVGDYRSAIRAHLVPAFGSLRLEAVTADRIEAWKATLRVGNRTKIKLLTVLRRHRAAPGRARS